MSITDRPIGEDDLQAYIDNHLSPENRAAVEAFLRNNSACAEHVRMDVALREQLRSRLAFKLAEPVPARLRVATIVAERSRRMRDRIRRRAIAAAALIVAGSLTWAGVTLLPSSRSVLARQDALISDAVSAHRLFASEIVHPVEVTADQEPHLVQWLSGRLGHPLTVPDLTALGFKLLGGRLLPAGPSVAAQFMYSDNKGARLTFYIRTGSAGEVALQSVQRNETANFFWSDDGLTYVVSGRMDRANLWPMAQAVFEQCERASRNEGS